MLKLFLADVPTPVDLRRIRGHCTLLLMQIKLTSSKYFLESGATDGYLMGTMSLEDTASDKLDHYMSGVRKATDKRHVEISKSLIEAGNYDADTLKLGDTDECEAVVIRYAEYKRNGCRKPPLRVRYARRVSKAYFRRKF